MVSNFKMRSTSILITVLLVISMMMPVGISNFSLNVTTLDAQATPGIAIGSYIKFAKYNGADIVWRVINLDNQGNPLLLSDKILTIKSYDSKGTYHTNANRQQYGSNYYMNSNIRQWLNSSESSISWIQNIPNTTNVSNNQNAYDTEKGFLSDGNFNQEERYMLKNHAHTTMLHDLDQAFKDGGTESHVYNTNIVDVVQNHDQAYYQNVSEKVFLLNVKELKEYVYDRGYSILAQPTPQAVSASQYKDATLRSNLNYWYWVNTPRTGYPGTVRTVFSDGSVQSHGAFNSRIGVRPSIYLDVQNIVLSSGDGSSANPYVYSSTLQAPEDIALSSNTVAENQPAGTSVGTISATDTDVGDTVTFSLASGTGDSDNSSFTVDGTTLKTAASFDYDTKSTYSIRLRATDAIGFTYDEVFSIQVTNVNEAMTTLSLGDENIDENAGANAVVATLSADDPDGQGSLVFSLESGSGDTDNASFKISGNQLQAVASLNYETKSSYSIRIGVTDGSFSASESFTLFVNNTNDAPSDIDLSNNSLSESDPSGTVVGNLSSVDEDSSDTHSYSLVSGTGSSDNSLFQIDGTAVKSSSTLDYEDKSTYSIRVRTTDSNNGTYEEVFLIQLTDVDDTAPSTPTGLASSNLAATSFTLSWSASSDNVSVKSYEIYNGATLLGTAATTSFNVTGITPASTVNVSVVAVDGSGNKSNNSTALPVTTVDNLAPSVPTGLTASRIGSTDVDLTWTASTDNVAVAGYNLFRNGVFVGTITGNRYRVTGLSQFTSYQFSVSAFDAAKNRSARSTALSVTTIDGIAPTIPTNITLLNAYSNRALLTWTASTDNVSVSSYNVYVNGVVNKTVTSNRAEITGLTQLSLQSIRVQAIDPAKNRSGLSTVFTFNTTDGQAPTIPTNVAASSISKRGFTINWSASTDNVGVVGYHIYRNGNYVNTVKNGATSFIFGGLAFNSSHQISIVAFDLAGNKSAQSTAISVDTTFTPDPVAPTAPTNVASSNVQTNEFRVTWTAATDNVGVTSYNIYRNGTYLATVIGSATGYTVKNLTAGTAYTIVIRALDAEKNGTDSSSISVTTLP